MSFFENFRIALDALWANRLRSFLALLGIVIGVFAVTLMVSLGEIIKAGISKDLEAVAGRSIIVQPDFNAGMTMQKLKQRDLDNFSTLPVSVNPQISVSAQYEKKPGERRSIGLYGTIGDLQRIDPSIRLGRGRYFSRSEEEGGMALLVLNPNAARELFGNAEPVGRRVRLYYPDSGRGEFTVVGVIEAQPAMFGGDVPQAYAACHYLWNTHPSTRRGEYDFALLRLHEGAQTKTIENQVRSMVEQRYPKGTFRIDSMESFQSVFGNIMVGLQVFLGFIGFLALLVGGIGIMNIMLVSVTERTREIGLRKALGATSAQIRTQFLIEAVALTSIGGLLGTILAVGILAAIVAGFPSFFKVFIISPITVIVALTVSIGVGLIFGVVPAARAANLDPIESLRYE